MVKGKSISQSISFYDFKTNFCNLWNTYKYTFDYGYDKVLLVECKYIAEDPESYCVKTTTTTK